jgi:very-short-patch-repair endonuclease
LSRPIKNVVPRRISFGFTTLNDSLTSNNILQLYNIAPTEQIVENGLRRMGIKVFPQYYFLNNKKRFRLDFAVFCKNGSIAVECDNKRAHSGKYHREKDKIKDISLQQHGWVVIHLTEQEILSDLKACIKRVQKAVKKFGGLV